RGHRGQYGILEAAVSPMAVWCHDSRERTLLAERPVQIATEVKAWIGFEQYLLDCVVAALEFAEDLRVERGLLRHRQQSGARQDLLAKEGSFSQPFRAAGELRHLKMCVHVRYRCIANILTGNLLRRQRCAYECE